MLNDFQSSGDDGNTMLHYDDKRYDIFWQTMEELDRPVYMHPRLSSPLIHQQLYAKRPWLEACACFAGSPKPIIDGAQFGMGFR